MASIRVGLTQGSCPLPINRVICSSAGASVCGQWGRGFGVQALVGSVLLEWGSPTSYPPGVGDHPHAFCLPFLWHLCAPRPQNPRCKILLGRSLDPLCLVRNNEVITGRLMSCASAML